MAAFYATINQARYEPFELTANKTSRAWFIGRLSERTSQSWHKKSAIVMARIKE
ncbi:hypothetical protein G7083_12505 (plasmid) [Vibrio sp. HDW18]|uniref:hypothetical protein n=1 Tax=Vibrio sp. HDW18 TaxID=2714948 RepID=UPI00140BBDB7|nr:hypothetical protein [Vibrio sp. HDW18]QIL86718.1 hypothetical protein G7083_12505 [Vibrio sp. HDW18]